MPTDKKTASKPRAYKEAKALLDWYDRHARQLPWRAPPHSGRPTPAYRVWLSEIMLQQTTVATVGPYFEKFLSLWPTVEDLAAASQDQVLHAWAGLGYYSRARNLHKCAQVVVAEHQGIFPATEDALLTLPGIGPYTAAAITSIAFDRKATVMDGNVERVIARYFAIKTPLPAAKKELKQLAGELTPNKRPGDYAQAVMDLGATTCTPRNPSCSRCPLAKNCRALDQDIVETLPARLPKKKKPTRRGTAFWLTRKDGAIWLRKRPEKGLLASMMEIPSTEWHEEAVLGEAEMPTRAKWHRAPGIVRHTFTHFHLELAVVSAKVATTPSLEGIWVQPEALDAYALPTVMKKIIAHALEGGTPSK